MVQVFKLLEAKETGKSFASRLLDLQGTEAASSSHHRKRNANSARDTKIYDKKKVELCGYCGKKETRKKFLPKRMSCIRTYRFKHIVFIYIKL